MSPAKKAAAAHIADAHTWALELLEETLGRLKPIDTYKAASAARLRQEVAEVVEWLDSAIQRRKAGMAVLP